MYWNQDGAGESDKDAKGVVVVVQGGSWEAFGRLDRSTGGTVQAIGADRANINGVIVTVGSIGCFLNGKRRQ